MTLTITPVRPEDHADWLALFRAYGDFYKTDTATAEAPVWQWIADPNEAYWSDIARDATGKAVGLVQYSLLHRSLSGAQCPP